MKLKSPEPFWLVKDGIKYSYPSLRENIENRNPYHWWRNYRFFSCPSNDKRWF